LLLLSSWFGFRWWQSFSATVWKYLPENTFLVIQSTRLQDTSFQLHRGDLDLKEIPLMNKAAQQIELFRLLANDSLQANDFLKGRQITYALQKSSTNHFTFLTFMPLAAFDKKSWIETPSSINTRISTHIHEGQKIFDVSNLHSEPLFSYTFYNNFLVACVSGDILEDWIRFAKSPLNATNKSRFESVQQKSELSLFIDSGILSYALKNTSTTKADAGLLYFLSFLPPTESLHLDPLFSKNYPTLTSKAKKIKLEGYVDVLNNQPTSPFRSLYYLPNNTAVLYRLGFNKPAQFVSSLKSHLSEVSSDSINSSRDQFNILVKSDRRDSLYAFMEKELMLCQLEPNNTLTKGQLLLEKVRKNDVLEGLYRRLAILFNKNAELPFEQFQGLTIYNIDFYELPSVLFGGLFKGFPKCYVAFYKNYVVYANDRQVLKDYLIDLEYERTWANSETYKSFGEKTLKSSNFLLIVNSRKAKSYINGSFLDYVFNNLNYDISEKLPFDQLVFQTAFKDARAFASLTFAKTGRTTSQKVFNKLFLQQEKAVPKPIGGPYIVKNYPNGLEKILILNSKFELESPFVKEDKKRIIQQLDGPIIGDIHSVDFLSIGRLQYVLATQKSLYVIDEDDTQRYTSVPPIRLGKNQLITNFQRIESGIEGSYRFLIVDTEGYLYLWNGPNQQPIQINKSRPFKDLLLPVSEVEFEGKRHFLFTQSTGQIGLIKENGVIPAPFKIDLKTNIAGSFFAVASPETGQSKLFGLSKYGELFDISLTGKILSKSQLIRPDPATFFKTKAESNLKDWLLFRESETQFAILDKKGKELFVGQGLIPDQNNVQYHYLGADLQFISIKSGNYTTIYNFKGEQIGDKPIPSEVPIKVSLVDAYNKLLIYTYANGTLQTWSLKIR